MAKERERMCESSKEEQEGERGHMCKLTMLFTVVVRTQARCRTFPRQPKFSPLFIYFLKQRLNCVYTLKKRKNIYIPSPGSRLQTLVSSSMLMLSKCTIED